MSRPRRRQVVVGVAVAAVMAATVAVAANHGMAALAADQRHAGRLDRATAHLERRIALGRYARAHLTRERAEEAVLAVALPPMVDDQSILAALVSSSFSTDAALADEQRGQAGASSGSSPVLDVPVTVDVNGTGLDPLTAFAVELQRQPRLLAVSALSFTFTSGTSLRLTGTAFTAGRLADPLEGSVDR